MIGYYVHHVGHGHVHRAGALAAAVRDDLGEEVTGLSSAPRPEGWTGDWVRLDRDDRSTAPRDHTAGGWLHWAPLGDAGLRARTAGLSAWIDRARPRLMVSDVSVEVAVLSRLHGVPVLSVVLPGDRSDPAHRLGHHLSNALVGFWPSGLDGVVRGLDPADAARLHEVGALSRLTPVGAPDASRPTPGAPRRVTVMAGSGGLDSSWAAPLRRAREQTPGWEWTLLGDPRLLGPEARWVEDPAAALACADVVLTHAGQNAVAETAAAGRPAVVVPQERPHDEQAATARALTGGRWPVLVESSGLPGSGWADRLARVSRLDGSRWAGWCDERAPARFARIVRDAATPAPTPTQAGSGAGVDVSVVG